MRRSTSILLALSVVLGASAGVRSAEAKTDLFASNFVNSNEVQGMTVWKGLLAMATLGGLVTYDTDTGEFEKILRSPNGLPSNDILSIEVSPSEQTGWQTPRSHTCVVEQAV